MTVYTEPSVDDLRKESERTRAALTNTVSELREKVGETASDLKARVSPANIKEELKDYVRESRQNLVQSLEQKVRENPLQAVAVGAALAYPLWGVVRTIPAPLMLIGAGLWFASKGGKDTVDQLKHEVGDVAGKASAQVADLAASAQTAAGEAASRLADTITEGKATLSSGVASAAGTVAAVAHDIRDSAARVGQTVVDSVTNNVPTATDAASQMVSDVKDSVVTAGQQSRDMFVDLVERNPLLVGGIGLAIGAFIAASLPPSNAENRIFGDRSEDLKEKAREIASQGVERAKDVAAGVVGEMASTAARQGLDADSIKQAVAGVTRSVKAVADRGVQTALGGQQFPASENSSPAHKS